jgi:Zn-dependent M28 family amino/carboxypeptidase
MNKYVGFRFKYDAEDVYTRSDHYNFAAKGIPIAFLFDGFHPDYHQPTDTVDKIDFAKIVNAARLYYLSVMSVANRPLPLKKDVPQGQ